MLILLGYAAALYMEKRHATEHGWLSAALFPSGALAARLPEAMASWLVKRGQSLFKALSAPMPAWSSTIQAPWRVKPLNMPALVVASGIQIADAEATLKHSWTNRLLLVEALTHSGATEPCCRLAQLGTPLLEAMLIELLIKSADFPLVTARLPFENNAATPRLETYAVPWLPGESRSWPKLPWQLSGDKASMVQGPRIKYASCLLELLGACCNNVAYAHACVAIGLHKFIASGSEELQ